MNIYDQISSNKRRSFLFVFVFVVMILMLGYLIARVYNSPGIFVLAVGISLIQSLAGYYSGDKVALAVSGAKQISKKDNPLLWNLVENLSIADGLPMPKVYVIDDPAPNAFATGRDPEHASVAVTTGLMNALEKVEIEGVLAHELSHVKNYDIRLMTIVVVLVGIIAVISDLFFRMRFFGFGGGDSDDNNNGSSGTLWLVLTILTIIIAPIVSTLIQLAISRRREFLADSSGALLTRYPEGLASALTKISRYEAPMKTASSSTSHLFISNPFGKESYVSKLFSTHPPISERVKALRAMDK